MFAESQAVKARSRDDSKRRRNNARRASQTPINPPTCGHIGRLRRLIEDVDSEWPFSKAARIAADEDIPLLRAEAQHTFLALMPHADYKRYGFLHRALLFGAVAAALRYKCFSRIAAFLGNTARGSLIINYFDDYGPHPTRKFG